jgi:hypothetical protein
MVKTVGDFLNLIKIHFMKKYFFSLLLVGSFSFSQSVESLKLETKKFYEANYLMDFEVIVAAYYPKMVESIGKEKMLLETEKQFENEEYRLRFQLETVPFLFGKITKKQNQSFCVVRCRNPIRYFFETKLTDEKAIEKATWLKNINKTTEVTFEPKRNSFNVRRATIFIAVMDENTNNQWKFFNLDDAKQIELFQTLFGESLLKELGL